MINSFEVWKMTKAEKALDEVTEIISKKTRQEQDAFLQQILFGLR